MILVIVTGLAACGPASSDNPPGQESRVTVSGPASRSTGQGGKIFTSPKAADNQTGSASGTATVPGRDNAGQVGKFLSKPEAPPTVETAARDTLPFPDIPASIVKGLDSPDARDRLQALDHWEQKGSKPSLDPVFEALEDENEAVRAKATAIIEQYWEQGKERERG